MNCSANVVVARKLVNRIHLTQNEHYRWMSEQVMNKKRRANKRASERGRTNKFIYRIIIKGKLRENICISIILFLSEPSVWACVYDIESLDLHNTFLIQSLLIWIHFVNRAIASASIQKREKRSETGENEWLYRCTYEAQTPRTTQSTYCE